MSNSGSKISTKRPSSTVVVTLTHALAALYRSSLLHLSSFCFFALHGPQWVKVYARKSRGATLQIEHNLTPFSSTNSLLLLDSPFFFLVSAPAAEAFSSSADRRMGFSRFPPEAKFFLLKASTYCLIPYSFSFEMQSELNIH